MPPSTGVAPDLFQGPDYYFRDVDSEERLKLFQIDP